VMKRRRIPALRPRDPRPHTSGHGTPEPLDRWPHTDQLRVNSAYNCLSDTGRIRRWSGV